MEVSRYDPIPKRSGFTAAAAVWKWDSGRQRFRLQQVAYEPKGKKAKAPRVTKRKAKVKRGAVSAEQGQLSL